jgi:hypothetical protein
MSKKNNPGCGCCTTASCDIETLCPSTRYRLSFKLVPSDPNILITVNGVSVYRDFDVFTQQYPGDTAIMTISYDSSINAWIGSTTTPYLEPDYGRKWWIKLYSIVEQSIFPYSTITEHYYSSDADFFSGGYHYVTDTDDNLLTPQFCISGPYFSTISGQYPYGIDYICYTQTCDDITYSGPLSSYLSYLPKFIWQPIYPIITISGLSTTKQGNLSGTYIPTEVCKSANRIYCLTIPSSFLYGYDGYSIPPVIDPRDGVGGFPYTGYYFINSVCLASLADWKKVLYLEGDTQEVSIYFITIPYGTNFPEFFPVVYSNPLGILTPRFQGNTLTVEMTDTLRYLTFMTFPATITTEVQNF